MEREPVLNYLEEDFVTKANVKCPLCGCASTRLFALPHTIVRKCTVQHCGLRFAHPQPEERTLAQDYTNLYYPGEHNGTGKIENTAESILRQVFEQLERRFGALEGFRLLDYGCGIGTLLKVAREFGLHPTGIEPDPHARSTAARVQGARVYKDIADLVLADREAKFDLVILWTVIEHLRHPWEDLAALLPLLCPAGRILISTVDVRCLRARLQGKHWEQYRNPTHMYFFDSKSIAQVIRKAGCSTVSQWNLKIEYPHHTTARRWFFNLMFKMGLADGLFFVCEKPSRAEEPKPDAMGNSDDRVLELQ